MVFAMQPRGHPSSIAWLWRLRGFHYWVPWDYSNQKQFLADYHSQGTAKMADDITPPVFLRKKPIYLPRSFDLRSRLLVRDTSRGLQSCSRGIAAGGHNLCILLLPCFSLPVSSRKKFTPLFGVPIFKLSPGDTIWSSSGGQWGSGLWVPQNCKQQRKSSSVTTTPWEQQEAREPGAQSFCEKG